jgi:hypothetical protein
LEIPVDSVVFLEPHSDREGERDQVASATEPFFFGDMRVAESMDFDPVTNFGPDR